MKLLADENFPVASVNILEAAGFDIKFVGISSPGISDNEVISFAIAEDRLILTFDRDFGELIFKGNLKPDAGVVYLRFRDFAPDFPGEYLKKIFNESNLTFRNTLTVTDGSFIRQRKYRTI